MYCLSSQREQREILTVQGCRGHCGPDVQMGLRMLTPELGRWEDVEVYSTSRPCMRDGCSLICRGDQVLPPGLLAPSMSLAVTDFYWLFLAVTQTAALRRLATTLHWGLVLVLSVLGTNTAFGQM